MKNIDRSWTEIDLDVFEYNLNNLRKLIKPGKKIMQIVKADAYGHGADQIAKKAIESGADFLGVANADEGKILREYGIRSSILILSPSLVSEIDVIFDFDLTPTISSYRFAEEIDSNAETMGIIKEIHVNIDTGMGRSGLQFSAAKDVLKKIQKLTNLKVEGIFSHYASSEDDLEFTEIQADRFRTFLDDLPARPEYIHIANSSSLLTYSDNYTNLVRIGLLSYGIYTDYSMQDKIDLKPVMTFKSYIAQIKSASKNESIGYNRTYICDKYTKYAILPVGYADGYDFMLSNKGKVLIRNKICDVIGKISMDMLAVDITDLPDAELMDEVVLLGGNNRETRTENLTGSYNGSSYELLCQIGRRAKRYYKENGKIVASAPLLRRDFVSSDYSDLKLNRIIEAAMEQRLQSKEMANLLYKDLLERYIKEKDLEIYYRKGFKHTVSFSPSAGPGREDYYSVTTTLKYSKILREKSFYVVCAGNETDLEKYFLRNDVEYRWLLDESMKLNETNFEITEVKINDLDLSSDSRLVNSCQEIFCSNEELADLVNTEVEYSISTRTFYPKSYNQLAVFISEMTQGVEIEFRFGELFNSVEAIPIFSGRNKFPKLKKGTGDLKISSSTDEWIFPLSGVVFVYK